MWQRLDREESACSIATLPVRRDLDDLDPGLALGRRWRHDRDDFWKRLSPLGHVFASEDLDVPRLNQNAADAGQPRAADDARAEAPATDTDLADPQRSDPEASFLARGRVELLEEARRDVVAARARRLGAPEVDLRLSGIDGFMDEPEADEEGSWR